MIFKFGERVLVKAKITRHLEDGKHFWFREEYAKPKEAIFLTKRTLQDGSYGYEDTGGDFAWAPDVKTYIPGAWICREGKNPEKVFLSDIEILVDVDLEENHSPLALEIAGLIFKMLEKRT